MIQEGAVFYFKGSEPNPHYHIVILRDPRGLDKRSIVVYLSTSKTHVDNACTFQKGDDFFITEICWVRYRNSKIISDADMKNFQYLGIAKDSTVEKIRNGFMERLKIIPGDVRYAYENWHDDYLFSKI